MSSKLLFTVIQSFEKVFSWFMKFSFPLIPKSILLKAGTADLHIHICLVDCCRNHSFGNINKKLSRPKHQESYFSLKIVETLLILQTTIKLMVLEDFHTGTVFIFSWWQCPQLVGFVVCTPKVSSILFLRIWRCVLPNSSGKNVPCSIPSGWLGEYKIQTKFNITWYQHKATEV